MAPILTTNQTINKKLIAEIDLGVFERVLIGDDFSLEDAERFTDKVIGFFEDKIKRIESLRSSLQSLDHSSWGAETGHDGLNDMLGVLMSVSLERERIKSEVLSLMKLR